MKQIFYLLFLILPVFATSQTGLPASGVTAADNLIRNFMTNYGVPGLTFALSKNEKTVYMRSFGYSDLAKTVATQPYNLFRIASDSKPITGVAVVKLMEEGKLNMSDKVFGPGGILEHHPEISTANITDVRIYNITVQQLLEHTGGWDRSVNCNPNPTPPYPWYFAGCDPINNPLTVAQALGVPNPLKEPDYIKYLLEKGLNFAPGTAYAYSNIGYLVLGEIIREKTGKSYEEYVQTEIFHPLGIYDAHIGGNLLSEKQEREVEYFNGTEGNNLSVYGDGSLVPWAYGGMNVHAMSAHGGWIITARDLLKLLSAVDGFSTKPDILSPATITTMTTPSTVEANYAKGWQVNIYNNWWHTGAIPGTASELVRAGNGYSWVILANYRSTNANFWTALDNLGWNVQNAVAWGTNYDLMLFPEQNASGITFSGVAENQITLQWNNGDGNMRLVMVNEGAPVDRFPSDGTEYVANADYTAAPGLGGNNKIVYNGSGNSVTVTGLLPGRTYYFRVTEYNKSTATGDYALYLLGGNPVASRVTAGAQPVSLISFEGMYRDQTVYLSWTTAQELNAASFVIEKSTDGNRFGALGVIDAKGNSVQQQRYEFSDLSGMASFSKVFYRLKMIDRDGSSEYSKVIAINVPMTQAFTVSPNPARDYVRLEGKWIAQVDVIDMTGKLLARKTANAPGYNLDVSTLKDGIYILKISGGDGEVFQQRLIIRK